MCLAAKRRKAMENPPPIFTQPTVPIEHCRLPRAAGSAARGSAVEGLWKGCGSDGEMGGEAGGREGE